MKNRNNIIIAAFAVLAAVAAVIVTVLLNYDFPAYKAKLDMYYLNEKHTGIIAERHTVRYSDRYDLVGVIVSELRDGPDNSRHGRIMPSDTEILSINFTDDESVVIDLSGQFLTDDASRNVLNTYAVTKSVCSDGTLKRVMVTVNGGEITDQDGNRLGYIAAADINLEDEEYSSEMRDVVLYFSDASGSGLVREERTITITDQQPVEQYIINELIKGPADSSMRQVLSEDTVLMSVDVEDNICYLNFKSNFLSKNSGGEAHERLVIYSIVNSLTELNTINRVQFLMDGKRADSFGSFDIYRYIPRDTSIIIDH